MCAICCAAFGQRSSVWARPRLGLRNIRSTSKAEQNCKRTPRGLGMAQDTWTDENLVKLKAGFDAGLSCAQIAMGIKGITRNAVIGKLNRLGLRRIYQAPRQPVERKAKPFREKKFKR